MFEAISDAACLWMLGLMGRLPPDFQSLVGLAEKPSPLSHAQNTPDEKSGGKP